MSRAIGSRMLAAVLAGAALLGAAEVAAQSPTDSVALARLRTRLASLERVRVLTASSLVEIEQPRLALGGITWSTLRPVGEAADTPRIAAPLPLESIRRIQARRPSIVIGALVGGIAGAVVGQRVMDTSTHCRFSGSRTLCDNNIRSLLGYIALGAATGVAVGWRLPRWKTIWPS